MLCADWYGSSSRGASGGVGVAIAPMGSLEKLVLRPLVLFLDMGSLPYLLGFIKTTARPSLIRELGHAGPPPG